MKNKFKCPVKIWDKFSESAKEHYNNVMSKVINNKLNLLYSDAEVTAKEWEVLCHNFACIFAWEVEKVDVNV